jgi:hypothetical protein
MRSSVCLCLVLFTSLLSGCLADASQPEALVATSADECPSGGLGAQAYDDERGCLLDPVVLCARGALGEALGCARHPDTGQVFLTTNPFVPGEDQAWEECDDQETQLVVTAPQCAD